MSAHLFLFNMLHLQNTTPIEDTNESGNYGSSTGTTTDSSSCSGSEAGMLTLPTTCDKKEDSCCTYHPPKGLWRSKRIIVKRVFYSALQAKEIMAPRRRHLEVGTTTKAVPCKKQQQQTTTKNKSHLRRRSTRVVRPTLFLKNPFDDSIAMRHELSKPTSYWG